MKPFSTIAVLTLLVGCGSDFGVAPEAPVPSPAEADPLEGQLRIDRIVQAAQPQVDILWTIDNSGSMNCIVGCHGGNGNTDFVRVTDEFDTFMNFLDGSGLDFHIGVTTMDPGDEGALVEYDGVRWIDENTPDPVTTFTNLALSLGTSGSGTETGLGSTFQAYEDQAADANRGFFRANASTHTIVFSNENDQTDPTLITPREFELWFRGLRPTLDERTFNSIVCFSGAGGFEGPCSVAGQIYLTATENIGGISWDITSEDYGSLLERLAIQAVAQRAEFFLSAQPIIESIEVFVIIPDGPRVKLERITIDPETQEAEGQWDYVPVRNSIIFTDYRPPALSQLEIQYLIAGDVRPTETVDGEDKDKDEDK
ncbi:MAG: hypothetical protein AAGA48_05210 [Myxococcota bacterium]